MARMTHTLSTAFKPPRLGQVVFFHPERRSENTPATLPAIIHHISDASRGIVDLTVFSSNGPLVRQDVEPALGAGPGRWSHRQG
jgi:hypothetical protein